MLNPDYRDILFELSAAGAEYLVVGAYAMAAHGNPRATGDIDIWIRPSPKNAEKVYAALVAFGAPLTQVVEQDLVSPGLIFQIGIEPRRIDILTAIDEKRLPESLLSQGEPSAAPRGRWVESIG